MDDVTALRDALLAKLTSDWDFDPYGEHEAAVMRLRADLDALIAAAQQEARAGLVEACGHRRISYVEVCCVDCNRVLDRRTLGDRIPALAAFTPPATWHEYKPRSNRMGSPCQRCGQSPFYVDHAPPASVRFDTRKQQSTHDFSPQTTPEADR